MPDLWMNTRIPALYGKEERPKNLWQVYIQYVAVFRIHKFLGLLDPDPLVRGMNPDPDPSIIKQR